MNNETLTWYYDADETWRLRGEDGQHRAGIHRQTYGGRTFWVWTAFAKPYTDTFPNFQHGSTEELAKAQAAALAAALSLTGES